MEYYTVSETMKLLNVTSRNTIYRHIRTGKLKAVKQVYQKGQPLMITKSSVQAMLKSGLIQANNELGGEKQRDIFIG